MLHAFNIFATMLYASAALEGRRLAAISMRCDVDLRADAGPPRDDVHCIVGKIARA